MVNVTEKQLKILILTALKSSGGTMPLEVLSDILSDCDINTFDVQCCISELCEASHISLFEDGDESFAVISDTGRHIAEELRTDAPFSLREKVIAKTGSEMARVRRNISVEADYKAISENDYAVLLKLKDRELDLMALKMYAPTEFQAKMITENFTRDPYQTYKKILMALIIEEDSGETE